MAAFLLSSLTMMIQSRMLVAFTVFTVSSVGSFAQSPAPPSPTTRQTTFRGCLQGDPNKGFGLLSPTVTTGGGPGLMKTYRVVPPKDADLGKLVNKIVEITGTLSTAPSERHNIPATDVLGGRRVVDSVQTAPTTPEQGQQTWSDGTLSAQKIRQLENSCAAGVRTK
jgi:hypothetical protein